MLTQPTTEATLDTRIPQRWLTLVRVIWFVSVLTFLAIFIVGISPRFNELRVTCVAEEHEECVVLSLSPQEASALSDLGLSMDIYSGFHIGIEIFAAGIFSLLAVVIFSRRSGDTVGVLVSLTLVVIGSSFLSEGDSALARLYPSWGVPVNLLNTLAVVPFVSLLYLFPNGRFVPRWARLLMLVLTGVALLDPFLRTRDVTTPSDQFSVVYLIVVLACLVVGIWAQIYRYRNVSTLVQRQQTKWVVLGLLGMVMGIFAWSFFIELFPLQPGLPRLIFNTFGFGILITLIAFFPLSIAISILRYRLWDIDIVINRALVYGLLTGTLALVYFGSVTLMQSLFATVSGQQSTIAIVISTLAIAALFTPLRTRVQDFIDRRFFRRKYDAAKTLAAFAATVRDEPELERLSESLLTVVQETMQPAHVSLWLKKTADSRPQTADGRHSASP